jgi:hypothetical protein
MNLIIQQTRAKATKVRYTTIFDQNRTQNTCNNALLGKTPCIHHLEKYVKNSITYTHLKIP